MTPDAVIYRYMQIIAPTECDTEALCLLLSADADLLNRWLQLLNIPADSSALAARIEALEPSEFHSLAAAQAWSVLPIVGSARLSLEQWMTVLRAACLAEVLARYASEEQQQVLVDGAINIRLRALLAISGVQLPQDPRLQSLIEFRGTNPALLEDATLEMRIFAVVDALEVGREAELAQQLLGLTADTFDGLLSEADKLAEQQMGELALISDDVDWTHRIWLRQQISIVTASFAQCKSWQDVFLLHQLVSRCLFEKAPLLIYQPEPGAPLELGGSTEFAISLESRTSLVAATARGTATRVMRETADLAVVDRFLLRTLACEEALVLPLHLGERSALLMVAIEEDNDIEVAAELYAEALAQQIQHVDEATEDSQDTASDLLAQFRSAEYKRLREIVHEANNPLSIVHNYLHILELRLQHEPEAVEQLNLIGSELRRAADVFTRARDIPQQTQVEVPVAGEIVEIEAVTWARGTAELHSGYAAQAGVSLRTQLAPQPILLHTQQDKLTQIISNLLKNAIEACGPGDEVLLSVRGGVYREGRLGLELSVEDSGPGLTEDVLLSLGEAKVSSKGGDHQGVGMQVAFKLAAEIDGALDVRTELDQGTLFSLFLPLRREIQPES